MAARSQLAFLATILLHGWTSAQSISLQVTSIPPEATRIVAVVDQGALASPQRLAQNVTAGVSSANLSIPVPAGGAYRVRAIAFTAGSTYPAILRSGKTSGIGVPNNGAGTAKIALGNLNGALETSTPTSAPAGSTVTLAATFADPGDAGRGATGARIYTLASPLTTNQGGDILTGPFERRAEGVYRLSVAVAAPPSGSTLYYQFAYNAMDFNDPNALELPYLFWPNLNAGLAPLSLSAQGSSVINVTVSGLPAGGNRVVAIVDGAALTRAVRAVKDYTPGLSATSMSIDVPAGGAYRVRLAAFPSGSHAPAILRTGKAAGLTSPANAAVTLAEPVFTPLPDTPASAAAGSSLTLVTALADPGDAAAGVAVASVFSRTTPFSANRDGAESRGLLETVGTGSYRLSVPMALPATAATLYYQFAVPATEFNNPNGNENPHFCWPNLQAGQALRQITTTLSSSLRINFSGVPAAATRVVALVDQGALGSPARAAVSFPAGQAPASITLGVPAGGPYRARLIAFRSGPDTPVILRSGKTTGVTILSGTTATATVALGDYAAVVDPATPTAGTAGAQVTVIVNVSDPGETAAGVTASRLYASSSAFSQNLTPAPAQGLLEKYPDGTLKLSTPVTLPGAGGVLYYQTSFEALDFGDREGGERPIFCWPNLEAAQALRQISVNANPTVYTISGSVTLGGNGLANVSVTLSGPRSASLITEAGGEYAFPGLSAGTYTVSVARTNFTFAPASLTVTVPPHATANFSVSQVIGTIAVSRGVLRFGATAGGSAIGAAQEVAVDISDNLPVVWNVASDKSWLRVTPASGRGSGSFLVSLNPAALPAAGIYQGTLTLTTTTSTSARITIDVYLAVSPSGGAPFGAFDTPVDGATGLSANVPVTGWALDDVGVKTVQLWRERVGSEPVASNGLVYIADMIFVADARPDLAALFADKPNAYRAGWGYLLLTNFLPGVAGAPAGNGTYRLHAIAIDEEGKQTKLGVKTITVNNANAVKPFGTIDTPAQGATISGTDYINFGWALTPQPHKIAEDGSKVLVSVDGVFLGSVNYNRYRSDIATAFPNYANSAGGVGYFFLDTTQFANGIHSIGWLVTDEAGRADGVGSRFFSIRNTAEVGAAADGASTRAGPGWHARDGQIPEFELVEELPPAHPAVPLADLAVEELGRVELSLPPGPPWRGRMLQGAGHVRLPAGSTLDPGRGLFVWQLGPGFLGPYTLEFYHANETRTVRVTVNPATGHSTGN